MAGCGPCGALALAEQQELVQELVLVLVLALELVLELT